MNVWYKKMQLLLHNVETFTGSDEDVVIYSSGTSLEDILESGIKREAKNEAHT
jgi:hypothetical protein